MQLMVELLIDIACSVIR